MPGAQEALDLPDRVLAFGYGPPGGVRMRGLAVGLIPHSRTSTSSSPTAPTCPTRRASSRAPASASATSSVRDLAEVARPALRALIEAQAERKRPPPH